MRRKLLLMAISLIIFFMGIIVGLGYATYWTLYPPPMIPVGLLVWS